MCVIIRMRKLLEFWIIHYTQMAKSIEEKAWKRGLRYFVQRERGEM